MEICVGLCAWYEVYPDILLPLLLEKRFIVLYMHKTKLVRWSLARCGYANHEISCGCFIDDNVDRQTES